MNASHIPPARKGTILVVCQGHTVPVARVWVSARMPEIPRGGTGDDRNKTTKNKTKKGQNNPACGGQKNPYMT